MELILFKALAAGISAVGFSVMLNIPRKLIIFPAIVGSISFFTYLLIENNGRDFIIATVAGSFVVGVLGEIFASFNKQPSTLFTIPGILPLVPGYAIYYAMLYLVQNNLSSASEKATAALFTAIAIACGIALSATIMRKLRPVLDRFFKKNKPALK